MKKAFYVDFVSSMYITDVETREEAEKVFWERMTEMENQFNTGICWTEVNAIEEDEIYDE